MIWAERRDVLVKTKPQVIGKVLVEEELDEIRFVLGAYSVTLLRQVKIKPGAYGCESVDPLAVAGASGEFSDSYANGLEVLGIEEVFRMHEAFEVIVHERKESGHRDFVQRTIGEHTHQLDLGSEVFDGPNLGEKLGQ